jgi:hypothetical protein
MRVIGFDSETERFRVAVMAPPAVCFQFAEVHAGGAVGRGEVLLARDALDSLVAHVSDPNTLLVGAETSYDVLVSVTTADVQRARWGKGITGHELLARWCAAYDADRVTDVLLRQKLLDLARGCYRYERNDAGAVVGVNSYGLASVAWRHCGIDLNKQNPWRLRYSELADVPIAQWPPDAYEYARDDAVATAAVWPAQYRPSLRVNQNFPGKGPAEAFRDEFRQARGALWLKAMSVYGLRTDPKAIASFEHYVQDQYVRCCTELLDYKLIRKEYVKDRAGLEAYLARKQLTGHFIAQKPDAPPAFSFSAANLDKAIDASKDQSLALLRAGALTSAQLIQEGIIRVKISKDTKAATARMLLVNPNAERTEPSKTAPSGNIRLDKDSCLATGDAALTAYAEYSHLGKQLSTDLKILRRGVDLPIHSHFEPLLETGRTSSADPNVQNQARGGEVRCPACQGVSAHQPGPEQWHCWTCENAGTISAAGARECFVPRQGCVLVDCDYAMLELHTLAQTCYWLLGWSSLGDALKAGLDPHTAVACQILGIDYKEGKRRKALKGRAGNTPEENKLAQEFDDARNAAKAVNFGRPGGLGKATLRSYAAKSYNVVKTEEEWQVIIERWNATWGEMPEYFRMVNKLEGYEGAGFFNVIQPWSGRLRAGATYCSACNSFYQGLGADVAKLAGWKIFKACYVDTASPLFGARPVNFIHDQFLVEVKEDGNEAAAADEIGRLMNEAGLEVLPDVPVKCEPILARRWSKLASKVVGENGKLTAWEDLRLTA